jgi:hypothetical protein
MIRRLGFVTVLVAALIVSACGRQVTPNRSGTGPGGLQSGYMSVKFRVATGFNFSANSYVIVFNTSNPSATNTVTPVAQASSNNYAGYSIAIVVGGQNGAISAQAFYYFRPSGTSQQPVLYPINTTPQQLILTNNSNGQNNEFTVVFSRNIANFSLNATPLPSGSPSASPSVSPSPSTSPSAGPSSSPGGSGSGVPVTQYWTFNFFTVAGSIGQYANAGTLQILDSLGAGGGTDASYQSPVLDVSTAFDQTFQAQVGAAHPLLTPDAIAGGEIANNP